MGLQAQGWKQRLVESQRLQRAIKVAVMIGVGLLFGDGILTPSISGAALLSLLMCSCALL